MKLGKIQQDVMRFVNACHPLGTYIYNRSSGLSGYDESQVLRAIDGLVKRGILIRKGMLLHKVENNVDE